MNKLIMILALAVLAYMLFNWFKAKQDENSTKVLPVDYLGVVIEPNNLTVNDTMADIQSLV